LGLNPLATPLLIFKLLPEFAKLGNWGLTPLHLYHSVVVVVVVVVVVAAAAAVVHLCQIKS